MKYNQTLFLLSALLLFSCTGSDSKAPKEDAKQKETALVETVNLTPEQLQLAKLQFGTTQSIQMHKTLKVNGHMDVPPSNIVSISIPMGGYLKHTKLIPGNFVKKGGVIATMEDPSYIQLQQDYLTAISKLEFAEADYNRQKSLNETKATSDKVYQLAKADYEGQKYLVKSLSEKLKLIGVNPATLNENNISRTISIYAPIGGYITKANVNIGKYITPTDVLFEIVDPSDLHLRLTVLENDAASLKVGNTVQFYTNNNPAQKYMAHVAVVTPNIGEESTTDVHCHLVNEKINIFPGTFVNAEVELNNAKVNALPEQAIVKWQNKDYVFIKTTNQQFTLMAVDLGMVTNGFVEVKTNLNQKTVVIQNAYTLLMKLKNSGEE
jgi:cobalt-zinc-cadmium efflux system membrane fusion protein